jgi:Ca-activated chloride channel family protein
MNLPDISASVSALLPVHWLRPQWLWLLLALPLLAVSWRVLQRQRDVWREVVDPHLLPHLIEQSPAARMRSAPWLALLGAALAICALAGPSWQKTTQPLWQSRMPLVIALDLSSATAATDLPPSRLLQARAAIARLLQVRAGGQVGLVAFADDAYTVAPLTADAGNVALFLDALSPDIMPVDGSRADRAIAWSAKLLHQAGFEQGDILVLTDHADSAARAAASTAHRDGYRVSVLGLGTAAGAAYRDSEGRIAQTRLDADALRALAAAGSGDYAPVQGGDPATLDVLDPRKAKAAAGGKETTNLWRDQGYWLLPPLLLLVLLAFRRGGALAAVLLCAFLPLRPAHAATGWWQRPDQQAHAQLAQGAQAYKRDDYAGAARQWRALPGADAAYNLGNALAEQGNYDAAIAAYDRALRMQPGMRDAIENRRKVEQARKRRSKQQQNAQRPSPQQQHSKQQAGQQSPGQQQQPGQQQPGQQQPGQQQPGQQQPDQHNPTGSGQQSSQSSDPGTAGRQGPPPPARATSPEAQQRADAAQRQQMQQALRRSPEAKAGDDAQARAARAETPAQREKRLANEAWLRRVPDDPGGLLREKFRLEYERRQQGGR